MIVIFKLVIRPDCGSMSVTIVSYYIIIRNSNHFASQGLMKSQEASTRILQSNCDQSTVYPHVLVWQEPDQSFKIAIIIDFHQWSAFSL